jgi:hypothetical protein
VSDRDIKSWEERLDDQVRREWKNYQRIYVDLATARSLDQKVLTGEFLYVESVSSASANATIRLNRNTNEALVLEVGTVIKTIFRDFYLTNDAQPDEWMVLVVGINFEYYREQHGAEAQQSEAQEAEIVTNGSADTNTVGPDHPCNRVLIRAFTGNTGTAWVDFGTAAVANSCFELTAGDAISVPLSNTNRINLLFTIANDDVTVIYEV